MLPSGRFINAGKYRHWISIYNPPTDATRNAFGERVGTGSLVATVRAEKQDWSGSETKEAVVETATVTTRFDIRWRADIAPKMQVICDGEMYDIQSVMDLSGMRRELQLTCRKVES